MTGRLKNKVALVIGAARGIGRATARLLAARGADVVTFRDWQRIEAAEIAAARDGAPREKFTSIAAMLNARTS